MKQYLSLATDILFNGNYKEDRTGTGTISKFAEQMKFDLREGFPLVTTKKVSLRIVFEELMVFLRGETNLRKLLDKNVNVWNKDAYRYYCERVTGTAYYILTIEEYINKVKTDDEFAKEYGDLGRIYGAQWRGFRGPDGEVDQIKALVDMLKNNPDSRRMVVSAWNPSEMKEVALPCCHYAFETNVSNGQLSLRYIMRSNDFFLGAPFNIASYALLAHLLAADCGLEARELTASLGDVHIYKNHTNQMLAQIQREPRRLPKLIIKNKRENIWDYEWEDIELVGYDPHPRIEGVMST